MFRACLSADLHERRAGEIDELSLSTYLHTHILTYVHYPHIFNDPDVLITVECR